MLKYDFQLLCKFISCWFSDMVGNLMSQIGNFALSLGENKTFQGRNDLKESVAKNFIVGTT